MTQEEFDKQVFYYDSKAVISGKEYRIEQVNFETNIITVIVDETNNHCAEVRIQLIQKITR